MSKQKDAQQQTPDYLIMRGDGTLSPPDPDRGDAEQNPEPFTTPTGPPVTTAGKPAGDPAAGNPKNATGGKPSTSISVELAHAVPLQPAQRGKEEKSQDTGGAIVGKALAPQLGSSPQFLNRQEIDERKVSVLNFYTQTAYNYLGFRGYVDNIRFWAWFVDAELVTSQAIDGLGRRHILRAIEASSGSSVTEVAKKPNVIERNIWNRTWREKAERSGQAVEE